MGGDRRLDPFGGVASAGLRQPRRGGLGGIELAGGRLEADALTVALCRLRDLLIERTLGVVVVPENAGDHHDGCPANLYGVLRVPLCLVTLVLTILLCRRMVGGEDWTTWLPHSW